MHILVGIHSSPCTSFLIIFYLHSSKYWFCYIWIIDFCPLVLNSIKVTLRIFLNHNKTTKIQFCIQVFSSLSFSLLSLFHRGKFNMIKVNNICVQKLNFLISLTWLQPRHPRRHTNNQIKRVYKESSNSHFTICIHHHPVH